jgi:hypothetical protein
MTPADLLDTCRDLLRRPALAGAAGWSRAIALLARQALEKAVEEFWIASPATADLCRCPRKTQFTCLPFYLNPRLARDVGYVWSALSNVCHYHPFELAPTAAELDGWIEAVAILLAAIGDSKAESQISLLKRGGQADA